MYGSEGVPLRHGKGLAGTPLAANLTCFGEATGIIRLSPADHFDILAITDWLMKYSTAKLRSEHEDITQKLMDLRRLKAVFLPKDMAFMEADFPHEYEKLTKVLYPRLLRTMSHGA